jgi:hypothetical protein
MATTHGWYHMAFVRLTQFALPLRGPEVLCKYNTYSTYLVCSTTTTETLCKNESRFVLELVDIGRGILSSHFDSDSDTIILVARVAFCIQSCTYF